MEAKGERDMDKARASVIGVIAAAVLLSGLLWLVPVGAGKSADEGRETPRREMTNEEANDQVKGLMDALEAGINQGNPELALTGFATGDAEWLGHQRQAVTEIIERLQGHGARLHYSHPSYWGHVGGGKEVVSRRVYAGPTVVVDTVAGAVVGEVERYAIAPDGRFVLHPFPESDLRVGYQTSLGAIYSGLGQTEGAFAVWRGVIEDFPDADPSAIARVYERMAGAHAKGGDATSAYVDYERALALVGGSHSFTGVQVEGRMIRVTTRERIELKLAEVASQMDGGERARQWYESLAKSETEELADLARTRLAEL